jgi:hypothetical protein
MFIVDIGKVKNVIASIINKPKRPKTKPDNSVFSKPIFGITL